MYTNKVGISRARSSMRGISSKDFQNSKKTHDISATNNQSSKANELKQRDPKVL